MYAFTTYGGPTLTPIVYDYLLFLEEPPLSLETGHRKGSEGKGPPTAAAANVGGHQSRCP